MLRRSSSRQLQNPALCLILTLLEPVKESANRGMRDSKPCVKAVVEALREVCSAGSQVVVMGPQLRRKVAVDPRRLIVSSKTRSNTLCMAFIAARSKSIKKYFISPMSPNLAVSADLRLPNISSYVSAVLLGSSAQASGRPSPFWKPLMVYS